MSEPSKEAMEKARGIAERQFIEAPTESEQNFVDSIVPEIALEFTNYQKRIDGLEHNLKVQEKANRDYLSDASKRIVDAQSERDAANKRIKELEKCEKWLLHTEDCMNYSKCRCGLDEFISHLAKGVKE
jgi:hypothetical protein